MGIEFKPVGNWNKAVLGEPGRGMGLMGKPTVFLICGKAGTGKTTLLANFIERSKGEITRLSPGEGADWSRITTAAVDEDWDPSAVRRLAAEAQDAGKTILAVVQEPSILQLEGEPAVIRLEGGTARATFCYMGHEITLP